MEKKDITSALKKQFGRLRTATTVTFVLLLIIQPLAFAGLYVFLLDEPMVGSWLGGLAIATFVLLLVMGVVLSVVSSASQRTRTMTNEIFDEELRDLRVSTKKAQVLQEISTAFSATLNFEKVMIKALDACSIVLEDMGIPAKALIGAIFLFENDELAPIASRRLLARDQGRRIAGKKGIVGLALTEAEPNSTNDPAQDPELKTYTAFQKCYTATALPLRAGFQIFGAMVLGTEIKTEFTEEHIKLFNAVAAQAVIALQNAELYQNLESEKQRIIEADEEARKELARNLHDGPTQSIAAIAMRINFIRALMNEDPGRAVQELKKVEDLAQETTREIRGMLFTLRPLVLESKGLGAAIETAMNKIRESDGMNLRLVGAEYADLLDEKAQGTVFYIVEEALGNARKYSKAKLIEVRLWREENLFVARIRDDGVGFDVEAVHEDYSSRGSLGMVNLRERAERISGSIQIESKIGKGTSVTLVVPLDKHGREGDLDF